MKIGKKFPEFTMKGLVKMEAEKVEELFEDFTLEKLTEGGKKWAVVFFYPKDFTFVCPTELKGFSDKVEDFKDLDTNIFSVSVDNEFSHHGWRKAHEDLKELKYPMLSDVSRKLSQELDILDEEGVSQRATYILDKEGIVRFIYITDGSVGRNPDEVLRVLEALQTDELCPCNWNAGDDHIKV